MDVMDLEIINSEKLLKATLHNDLEFIKKFNEFHPDIHWRNIRQPKTSETVLHLAAGAGHLSLIKYFLTAFENDHNTVNVKTDDGSTALHVAAQHSQPEITECLLSHGADVNAIRRGDWTPLALACTKTGPQASNTVSILLKHDASTKFTNKDGWTPLMLACRTGDLQICSKLASPSILSICSKTRRFPLHIACYHGHLDIVKHIYQSYFKDPSFTSFVNEKDACGTTPFLDAVHSGNLDLVKYLADEDVNLVDAVNNEGWNALHVAASNNKSSICEYLVTELEFSVDYQTKDKRKLTPLHCAARSKADDCIAILLLLGANEDLVDWQNRTYKDYLHNFRH